MWHGTSSVSATFQCVGLRPVSSGRLLVGMFVACAMALIGAMPNWAAAAPIWGRQFAYAVRQDLELGSDFIVRVNVASGVVEQRIGGITATMQYVAASTAAQKVFFTEQSTGNLVCLDIHTQALTRVYVGNNPHGVAVSPDGTRIYVALRGDNALAVLETDNLAAGPRTIPVGSNPIGVAVNPAGTLVYVANVLGNSLSAVDVRVDPPAVYTASLVSPTHADPRPIGVAIARDGLTAYVSLRNDSYVAVLDLSAAMPVLLGDVATFAGPFGIAANPLSPYVYTVSPAWSRLMYLKLDSSPISIPTAPDTGLNSNPIGVAVDDTGNRVLVSSEGVPGDGGAGRLIAYEAITGAPQWSLRLGYGRALVGNFVLEDRDSIFATGFE